MALSGDQEALLNLLLARGKSPDDVAGALGVGRNEVESRIEAALEELAPGEPPISSALALYLVGRADPISRADVASALEADPDLARRSESIAEALRARFPEAPVPRISGTPPSPGARDEGRPFGSAQRDTPESEGDPPEQPGRKPLDQGSRRLVSIIVSAAGLIAVVAAVVLLFGGSDEDPALDTGPTEASLSPVADQSGSGSVEFGFAGTNFAANISFSGLERSRRGQSYALWLDGPVGAFPVERVKVGNQGTVAGQAVLNEAVICFIAADLFTDLKLARSGDSEFRRALRQAVDSGTGGPFPEFTGQTILAGRIAMPDDTRQTLVRECGGRNPEAGNRGS